MKNIYGIFVFGLMLTAATFAEIDPKYKISSRIVGGAPAPTGRAPYQCSMQTKKFNQPSYHFCGCVVISLNWIVTAAHCVEQFQKYPIEIHGNMLKSMIKIQVGTNDLRGFNGGQSYYVDRIIVHSNYHHGDTPDGRMYSSHNDIALVRINGAIQFNSLVQPIEIATQDPPPGTRLLATGWGLTSPPVPGYQTQPNPFLQEISLNVVPQHECQALFPYPAYTSAGLLCAINSPNRGICMGDSGGPVVWGNVLVGVASFVNGCVNRRTPDVFTKVAYYRDWIKANAI